MHYVCDILILTVRTKSSFWSAYGSRWYRTAHHKHVGSWNVELDAIILQRISTALQAFQAGVMASTF